ncbi:Protein ELF4-LIKE 4 [Orobanche minor]
MEDDIFSAIANSSQIETKVRQTFQKNFVQVQHILDQNRLLINEINQNHESRIPDNLTRNVGLIRELNNNIRRVVDLYSDLSDSFTKSMDASSEGESGGTTKSDGRGGQKRIRSGGN